jgi:hypothetical protein
MPAKTASNRPALKKAYLFVVKNWAVKSADVATNLDTTPAEATKILRELSAKGLLEPMNVNGERALTWQSHYDIENSDAAKTLNSAKADFLAAFPIAGVTTSSRKGATGPRYTDAQIKKGLAAKKAGKTNAEVAKTAGVKSPAYFSKVLKALIAAEPKGSQAKAGRARQSRRVVRRSTKAAA